MNVVAAALRSNDLLRSRPAGSTCRTRQRLPVPLRSARAQRSSMCAIVLPPLASRTAGPPFPALVLDDAALDVADHLLLHRAMVASGGLPQPLVQRGRQPDGYPDLVVSHNARVVLVLALDELERLDQGPPEAA